MGREEGGIRGGGEEGVEAQTGRDRGEAGAGESDVLVLAR